MFKHLVVDVLRNGIDPVAMNDYHEIVLVRNSRIRLVRAFWDPVFLYLSPMMIMIKKRM